MFKVRQSLLFIALINFIIITSCTPGSQDFSPQLNTPEPPQNQPYEQMESFDINQKDVLEITSNKEKKKIEVKGIYIGNSLAEKNINTYIQLIKNTELNAVVFNLKDDNGNITYESDVDLVNRLEADKKANISDLKAFIKKLDDNNIYSIGRIVVFKDPYLAGKMEQWAMKKKAGGIWYDKQGIPWINPYEKKVWNYTISIAKEAAELGIDEIQFDYVRFPENGEKVNREVDFTNAAGKTKSEVIASFLAYADKELETYSVNISADVFGLITSINNDMNVGQLWEKMAPHLDYISPMMYPSHYSAGSYGIQIPDANPYLIIKNGLEDAIKKNQQLQEKGVSTPIIRPWYQSFTAAWVNGHIPYTKTEIDQQIKAGKELGIHQYLLWNSRGNYPLKQK